MVFEEAVVTHGIEATFASSNGIEAKCASPRWRPNPEIDWHRDRYPRDMINPAGRKHVNRQRSPLSNAKIFDYDLSSLHLFLRNWLSVTGCCITLYSTAIRLQFFLLDSCNWTPTLHTRQTLLVSN